MFDFSFSFFCGIPAHWDLNLIILSFLDRKWQPTLVFLPGDSHRQRSLVGYSPCWHSQTWQSDWTHTHTYTHTHTHTHTHTFCPLSCFFLSHTCFSFLYLSVLHSGEDLWVFFCSQLFLSLMFTTELSILLGHNKVLSFLHKRTHFLEQISALNSCTHIKFQLFVC